MKTGLAKFLYHTLAALGRPFGGLRPRSMYDVLGRIAYPTPKFSWVRNRWDSELFLSHSYHIDRNILLFGTYDEDLHRFLEQFLQPGMICFDVGANLGEMTLHMASKVKSTGMVYAFEPVPEVYQRLRLHVGKNNAENVIRTFPVALSNKNGSVVIHFCGRDADNQGLGSIVASSERSLPVSETVPALTLDEFVRREKVERIDLIKIDIQGAETAFLDGASQTLRELAPSLLVEISPEDLGGANKNSLDLVTQIENLGYNLYRIHNGKAGSRICSSSLSKTFKASNVVCMKNSGTEPPE